MNRNFLLSSICIFFLLNVSYGQAWYPLQTGITGDFGVAAEATYNGQLYVGGWFYQAGNVTATNMARWNGLTWDSVGSGLTGGGNEVEAMCVYNGNLYVGGEFFAAEGLAATNIAMWNGSHWDTVGGGLTYCGSGAGWADAMAVYNGKLYVAGAFCHAGNIAANNIACWDGAKWDSVSSGINDSVYALAVYNGKLYAGGQFTRAGSKSVNNIACWNDTAWDTVGAIKGANEPISALATYKGALYAGGEFDSIGLTPIGYIARWNDTAWLAVGAGIKGTSTIYNAGVYAFCVFNEMLYTGGFFDKAGTSVTNNIATWNGTAWDTLNTGGINSLVDAITVMDSSIYAGGSFTYAGNIAALNIAAWGGINLGTNEVENRGEEVMVYPNPSNGLFHVACHSEQSEESLSIVVYNVLGERVLTETFRSAQGDNAVNLTGQSAGVYLYRIIDESGSLINQGKIVIE